MKDDEREDDQVEIIRQVHGGQSGGEQNGDQAENVRQIAAKPVYQIENPSALVLWTASEHRVDRLKDHEHVGGDPEILV